MNDDAKDRVPLPGADKGGAWVRLSDRVYKIAPLNFKALRELAPLIGDLRGVIPGEVPTGDQMDILVKLSHAAISRNYPATTQDDVADGLDFGNFASVLNAVMGAAGLVGREVPESGEGMTPH